MPEVPSAQGQSIRAQSKKGKGQSSNDKAANREIIKPVLANPLTVPWPTLPKHLQTASFHALKQLIPDDIPAYHTSRDRCHKKERRQERSKKARDEIRVRNEARGVSTKDGVEYGANASPVQSGNEGHSKQATPLASDTAAAGEKRPLPSSTPDTAQPASKKQKILPAHSAKSTAPPSAPDSDPASSSNQTGTHPPNEQTPHARPDPPATLHHLVFGINETVKALERQTDQLRIRIMQLGEAIEAHETGLKKGGTGGAVKGDSGAGRTGAGGAARGLNASDDGSPAQHDKAGVSGQAAQVSLGQSTETDIVTATAPTAPPPSGISTGTSFSNTAQPIEYILIPLPDLNPPTLASHIPPYCATHNTLVYQFKHLWKIAKARLPAWHLAEVMEVMGFSATGGAGAGVAAVEAAGKRDRADVAACPGEVDVGDVQGVEQVDEVRVVPLGRVQAELSVLLGLRRVACVGVRTSHPDISTLRSLLPKSSLKPPRYSLTLPFPIPSTKLAVHDKPRSIALPPSRPVPGAAQRAHKEPSGNKPDLVPTAPGPAESSTSASNAKTSTGMEAGKTAKSSSAHPGKVTNMMTTTTASAPAGKATHALMPHVHYAPIHVKGLTTTVPADGNARKAKRMEEVRNKRREKKERKEMRRVM